MSRLTLTNKAKADLLEIGRYTQERWGHEQRNRYLTMLDSCFKQIAINPLKGKDCSDIRKGYRKFNVGSHVVYYHQADPETIEIIRVLHSRMDMEAQLS